jgi:UDP-2-acetamido-3-amino-2,3-dideoxy-glucuronate N-acetyltransferase
MLGNPARRSGWMCRCGIKLEIQDAEASCPSCGKSYAIHGGALSPA